MGLSLIASKLKLLLSFLETVVVLLRIVLIVLIMSKVHKNLCFLNFFWVYLNENCSKGNVRLVPVILGDGQMLDLYQLFSLVKEKGGYDAISRKWVVGFRDR